MVNSLKEVHNSASEVRQVSADMLARFGTFYKEMCDVLQRSEFRVRQHNIKEHAMAVTVSKGRAAMPISIVVGRDENGKEFVDIIPEKYGIILNTANEEESGAFERFPLADNTSIKAAARFIASCTGSCSTDRYISYRIA